MSVDAAAADAALHERLRKAIPVLGVATEERRTQGVETAKDASIWPIVGKAWPYLNRYISGRWKHFGAAAREAGGQPGGFLFMPLLITGLLAWWVLAGPLNGERVQAVWAQGANSGSFSRTQLWMLATTQLFALALGALAWLVWLTRGLTQVILSVISVVVALLLLFAAGIAPTGAVGKLGSYGLFLSLVAGWLLRLRVAAGAIGLSLRVETHVVYFYILSFISTQTRLISGLFTTDIFNTVILQGRPMTPFVANLFGHPSWARGVEFMGDMYLRVPDRLEIRWFYLGATLVVWFLFTLPFALGLPYYAVYIQQKINQNLRMDLLSRWTSLSPRYHAQHRVGDSIYRILQDSSGIVNIINRLYLGATAITAIIQALFLVCFFDLRIAMLGVGMMLLMSLFAWMYSPTLKARAIAARETNSDLTSSVQEIMTGVRVTKAYRQETREQLRFERDSVKAFDAAFRVRWLFTLTGVVSFIIVGCFILPADWLSAVWAQQEQPVLAAGLVALIGLSFSSWNLAAFRWVSSEMDIIAQRIRGVNTEWAAAQDNTMALRRVFEILETEPEIADPPHPVELTGFREEIRYEGVSFAYEPDRPVLKDVSFSVKPGSITAVVGPTGSGKSTLVAMLLRVFDPDAGRITIDGHDLRDFSLDSLREQVSVAPQEPILFAQSVLDNIRYATPEAHFDDIRRAAELACCDEVIADLPHGWDTVLGDRGAGLSPGQKQRLCIARALVKDAPIVILDEPTAPLDAETEHRVMGNLAKWAEGRAIFIITHRLSTVRRADHILFVEDGRLVEAGSHEAMMAREGGRYRAMVDAESALAERGVGA